MSTTTHPTSLEARVARLEAAGRRWRWLCAVLGAVVLGLGVAAAGPNDEKIPEKTEIAGWVRARRFEVVNENGKTAVLITAGEEGGRIFVANHLGISVFDVSAIKGGSALSVNRNPDGHASEGVVVITSDKGGGQILAVRGKEVVELFPPLQK